MKLALFRVQPFKPFIGYPLIKQYSLQLLIFSKLLLLEQLFSFFFIIRFKPFYFGYFRNSLNFHALLYTFGELKLVCGQIIHVLSILRQICLFLLFFLSVLCFVVTSNFLLQMAIIENLTIIVLVPVIIVCIFITMMIMMV